MQTGHDSCGPHVKVPQVLLKPTIQALQEFKETSSHHSQLEGLLRQFSDVHGESRRNWHLIHGIDTSDPRCNQVAYLVATWRWNPKPLCSHKLALSDKALGEMIRHCSAIKQSKGLPYAIGTKKKVCLPVSVSTCASWMKDSDEIVPYPINSGPIHSDRHLAFHNAISR